MTDYQLEALMEWVERLIDLKIECAFQRDAAHEEVMEERFRQELREAIRRNYEVY